MKKKMTGIMLLAALFSAVSAQAADNLQFRGNLVIPNCTINNNQPVEIDWGDVEIQEIKHAGINPKLHKSKDIDIVCPYGYGKPRMKISGVSGQFNNDTLATSKIDEGLIIILGYGDSFDVRKKITLNTEQEVEGFSLSSGRGVVRLQASLMNTKPIENLTPGEFTAGAAMEFRYQ
ncbi:fimbrial protein [Escherichia marmotae]|nr:fimbrial protein [Escherichia marmotae]